MRRTIIESPLQGDTNRNLVYARRCLRYSLDAGEAPIASHLLHTQVLDDNIPHERKLGIDAGLAWYPFCQKVIFCTDLGWSKGMLDAMARVVAEEIPYEIRRLETQKGSD